MLRVYRRNERSIQRVESLSELDSLDDVIWIDLQSPTEEQETEIEQQFRVLFLSEQEQSEIESSSRYNETADRIVANSNFLKIHKGEHLNSPVTFILKGSTLFTYREDDLRTFAETVKKIKQNTGLAQTAAQVLIAIFETRIDQDADMIENISKEVSGISKEIGINKHVHEDALLRIAEFQEITMLLRENIFDKQRVVSAMLRSERFQKNEYEKLRIVIKDINSLLEHTNFNFERLEYLQNTFLGLVNIEQNKTIKIFTVVSVIFMPPTLIASIYGMNFDIMPELHWAHGYLFAIFLMALSSFVTLFIFKRRGWL